MAKWLSRGLLFAALCGGRTSDAVGVEIAGDVEVGERIVANLAYVI